MTINANIEVFGRGKRSTVSRIATVVISLSLLASGCAVNGNSLPEVESSSDLITGSVSEKVQPEGVAKSDSEIIKYAVAENVSATSNAPIQWTNPATGSSGAVVSIDQFTGKHGQNCKGFKTSVSNFAGIAFYNGETCKVEAGQWVLSWFKVVN